MSHTVSAEMVASVHSVEVSVGGLVEAGAVLVVLESMKMEIPVLSELRGTITEVYVAPGDVVREGDALVVLE